MAETRYDSLEKMGKKQNKEQVPPAVAPESKKKPSSNKPSKKPSSINMVSRESHKTLEEAFKAVSKAQS